MFHIFYEKRIYFNPNPNPNPYCMSSHQALAGQSEGLTRRQQEDGQGRNPDTKGGPGYMNLSLSLYIIQEDRDGFGSKTCWSLC